MVEKKEIYQKENPNEDFNYVLKSIGKYINQERKRAGIKNAASFADSLDIAQSQYREYERGETDMKLSTLIRIFKGLGVSVEDLFKINLFKTEKDADNAPSLIKLKKEDQVRNQVEILQGASVEKDLDTEDIDRIITTLYYCTKYRTKNEILKEVNLSYKTTKFTKVFKLLLSCDWIEMKRPESPNIPNQSYRTTETGKVILKS